MFLEDKLSLKAIKVMVRLILGPQEAVLPPAVLWNCLKGLDITRVVFTVMSLEGLYSTVFCKLLC